MLNTKLDKDELLAMIKQADMEYYEDDNPSLSDEEYDALRNEYISRFGADDLDYTPGNVSGDFIPFKHPTPVTSLAKWKDGVDNKSTLLKRIKELWPICVQPKYDGLTVVAYQNDDGTCKFVSRGSGIEGEVLPNFMSRYENKTIALPGGYPVRGEVFLSKEAFDEINEDLVSSGEEPLKNQRNAAAGILRNKKRSKYIDKLSYVVYDMPGADLTPLEIEEQLKTTPFKTTMGITLSSIEEVSENLSMLHKTIIVCEDFPIDGLVVKSCQKNSLAKFGFTDHHPKNAFAWKPAATHYESIVRSVEWQVGKGKITPRATIDPVEIAGTTVTHATLDNIGQIREKGLMIGSRVELIKSGEIIPKITKVLSKGTEEIDINVCPCCGHKLTEVNGQYFCTNDECDERIVRAISFIAQKDVLDIEGLGVQVAREIVKKFNDESKRYKQNIIFRLTKDDLLTLPGFAEKKADNLYNNILSARENVPFERFIKALCFPMIGRTVGELLGKRYGDIYNFDLRGTYDDLIKIKGLGQKTAQVLCSIDFIEAFKNLEKYLTVLNYESAPTPTSNSEVSGKTFVLTGKMSRARSEYEDMIISAGGKVSNSVSKSTDYLVIADINSTSSKANKARSLGITLISPEDLEQMLS